MSQLEDGPTQLIPQVTPTSGPSKEPPQIHESSPGKVAMENQQKTIDKSQESDNEQKPPPLQASNMLREFQKSKVTTQASGPRPQMKRPLERNSMESEDEPNQDERVTPMPKSPSALLQKYLKPAPKIYKKKQIGNKKYVIHAQATRGIDSESFNAKNKKRDHKKHFNTYQMVECADDSEEENASLKFWSKKNMIRSMSSNPRGFAKLMSKKINLIDQIEELVRMENKQKKKPKANMFRSVDISLKERRNLSSVDSRHPRKDPSRDKILQIGTSSSIWEKTTHKKKVFKDKQKKKKRFKHLIYSSVQVERSGKHDFRNRPGRDEPEEGLKTSIYLANQSPSGLDFYSKVKRVESRPENHVTEDLSPLNNTLKMSVAAQDRKKFMLYRSNSRLDEADGITVELDEDRTVCLDDMETKLCLFFKKTLVYASKIELLKLKAQKENGEYNIYSLFRQFCDPDNGKLTITSMQLLVEVLQFPLEEYDISSIMLFLEKFKEVDPNALLELEYGEFRELFISHKVSTPEIYLFSNWTPDVNRHFDLPDSEFYLLRQILMLTSRQIQDLSRIVNALHAYTADSVFDYIALFNEENDKIDGHLNNFFYNEPEFQENKQSFQVKIDLKSARVQSQIERRPKSAKAQQLPSFSNNYTSKAFRNPSFAGNAETKVILENEEQFEQTNVTAEDKQRKEEAQVQGAAPVEPVKAVEPIEEVPMVEDTAGEEENYSSLVQPKSILNQYMRYQKIQRRKQLSGLSKGRKQNTEAVEPVKEIRAKKAEDTKEVKLEKEFQAEDQEEQQETLIMQQDEQGEVDMMNEMIVRAENRQVDAPRSKSVDSLVNMIDVSTIRNFLNFHGVMFLEEDLELVMHCMGSAHGIVDREGFKRFFYSPLWD